MSQIAPPRAGRPGSALLILGSMFAVAWLLRPSIEPMSARPLAPWPEPPVVVQEAPSLGDAGAAEQAVEDEARVAIGPTDTAVAAIHPLSVSALANAIDAQPVADAGSPPVRVDDRPLDVAPLLIASELVRPTTPRPADTNDRSVSGAVTSALATAFVKTGGSIGLAFRKTGAGLRAAF